MARRTIDRETRKTILSARRMVEECEKADGNEAETRRRVERIFESLMGYDPLKHLSREHAIRGAGETEHVDFAIQLELEASPAIVVELKRVTIDLAQKHLKQVSSYAINAGCEWILLTNGREWRLYHVSFGQPPETKLLKSWNLLADDPVDLAEAFDLVCYKSVRKDGLDTLWRKSNVLGPRNMLGAILGEPSIKLLRRELKKTTGVAIAPEDILGAVRRLLNEAALAELSAIRISLPGRKPRRRRPREPEAEVEVLPTTAEPALSVQGEETDTSQT